MVMSISIPERLGTGSLALLLKAAERWSCEERVCVGIPLTEGNSGCAT